MKRVSLWLLTLVALFLSSVSPASAVRPVGRMTDLGSLSDFGHTIPTAVNNRGQVVGYSDAGWNEWHMFLWERGEMLDLGVPPSGTPDFVWPSAVNEPGQIVGMLRTSQVPESAFLYEDGEWTLIRAEDSSWSDAVDINNRGQVLGYENPGSGPLEVFVWEDGHTTYLDLGLPSTASLIVPVDLTDRGEVVGYFADHSPGPGVPPLLRSFVWYRGELTEITAPGIGKVQAFEMNPRGQVAGQYYTGPGYGETRAFVWEDGVMTDLPDLGGGPSGAVAINRRGHITGVAMTPNGDMHAVLWEDGDILDLGTIGGAESYAYGINERDQVIGWSRTVSGAVHGFIWERELLPGGSFLDDSGNPHEANIEAIAAVGVTAGCAPRLFCPGGLVSRAEMAVFLLRALGEVGVSSYRGYFRDVGPGLWYTAAVERMFELGVSTGRPDGSFGPSEPVSRAEMAAFLLRALADPVWPEPLGVFTDVPADVWYRPLVERLYQRGITTGCAAGRYCPANPVRRDEMATFLTRAFGYTPIVPPPLEAGPVVSVTDGDTLRVSVGGVSERVRLIGIDAPEQSECGAAQASALMTQLVGGRTVTLARDT